MNDKMASIKQSDERHIQEKGSPATELATGHTVFALKMNCDFLLETSDAGTLTGSLGDYIVHDPQKGGMGLVNSPTFSLQYQFKVPS